MKTLKTRPKFAIINVRGLSLIYLLLIIITILFSRTFISNLLETGEIPGIIILSVFFVIPAVLLVILFISIIGIARDVLAREPGSRFQIKLIAYFLIVVLLAAIPVTLITSLSVSELVDFLRTINVDRAMSEAQRFAMESYSLNLEKLQKTAEETDLDSIMAGRENMPPGILAVQEFQLINNLWISNMYTGDERYRLAVMPSMQRGFISRVLPRDTDLIRYMILPEPNLARVVTQSLGRGFDSSLRIIADERERFEIIDSIRLNVRNLMIFYYGVFFLPALLMTVIIALTLSRRIAYPIVELTEATRRVAEGDFSIRILPRKGDELALLIQSFNAMVSDLEKSRKALLNNEKLTLWQDLSQRLAHEIKNPLMPIQLSAERVLRRWHGNPERIGEILENSMLAIIQEIEGITMLLGDFKTISRPMEITEAFTLLDELVRDIIKPYNSSHPNIIFNTEYLEKDISLKIDKNRLSQIFNNLILNSIDAMDEDGTIDIRTDLVKKEGSSYCRLSIRDTGKGIPKDDSREVFTPYYTTKESGTGLGLPIIERIVNDHGGTIWFDSGENKGTCFYIDLPLERKK